MTKLLKLFDLLPGWIWALVTAGALAVSLTVAFKLERAERQLSDLKAQHATELAAQVEASKAELERLTIANQEIQRDYNQAIADLDSVRSFSVARDRLRATERKAIADAANRISRACGDYAQAAERDIAVVEDDAERLGSEAVRASAAAHALKQTIDERRQTLEARRKALKPQEN